MGMVWKETGRVFRVAVCHNSVYWGRALSMTIGIHGSLHHTVGICVSVVYHGTLGDYIYTSTRSTRFHLQLSFFFISRLTLFHGQIGFTFHPILRSISVF